MNWRNVYRSVLLNWIEERGKKRMDKFNLLDCTLRDGGYITKWKFEEETIREIVKNLIDANLDFVETGYINPMSDDKDTTQFSSIERIKNYIPVDKKSCIILAMADVQQVTPEHITPYTGDSIEGIRIVFYKHQIESAIALAKVVKENGYKLFIGTGSGCGISFS